jgi:large subunit ribosomal protein L24
MKMKIKKGDNVQVMTGKNSGHQGRVLAVIPKDGRVIVEGANMVKRHVKLRAARGGRQGQEGGIINQEASVHASNVQVVCPSDGPTRVGYRISDDGAKTRVCKRCGGEL